MTMPIKNINYPSDEESVFDAVEDVVVGGDSLIKKKNALIAKLLKEIKTLEEKIKSIFAKDDNIHIKVVADAIGHIEDCLKINISEGNELNDVLLFEQSNMINMLLDIIKTSFSNILDTRINVETFLSQTYINETREYNQKLQALFGRVRREIAVIDDTILKTVGEDIQKYILQEDVLSRFRTFTELIKKADNSMALYEYVSNKIIEEVIKTNANLAYEIIAIVEELKSFELAKMFPPQQYKYKPTNPYFNNFGMVPVAPLCKITDVSMLLFKKPAKTVKAFVEICENKNYDLIIIRKSFGRGVGYNILQLLDFVESKNFANNHAAEDGITQDFVRRHSTIQYLNDSPDKWQISYNMVDNNNQFMVVLLQLNDELFSVLSTKLDLFSPQYFVRRAASKTLVDFVKNQMITNDRIDNYNTIVNDGIVQNMFLRVKPDLESIKVKSQIIDPKYLRNEIYLIILARFKELYAKKKPKNVYEFSKLLHDPSFNQIFSHVIMNEYYKYLFKNTAVYETENISMSEVYSSFVYTINIYERDFKKKMHDAFLHRIKEVRVFTDPKKDQLLEELFDNILKMVLQRIITNENNIFSSILYKLYLFKLSLLD
jgi:hypothetical protein